MRALRAYAGMQRSARTCVGARRQLNVNAALLPLSDRTRVFFCCALRDSFGAAGKQKRNRRFAFCPHPSRLLHCTHTHGTVTHHHLIHLSLNCVHVNAARCATIAKKVSPGQARHGPAGGPAPRLVLLLHTLQAAVVAEICVFVCFSSYVCGQQLYRAVGSWHVLCALTCHPCS